MKKKRGTNKPTATTGNLKPELENFRFWEQLAGQVLPDTKDATHINEVATMFYGLAVALNGEWDIITRICEKNDDKTITVSTAFQIDRRNQPAEVTTKVTYSEKHGQTVKRRVPAPGQEELPMEIVKGATGDPEENPPTDAD